jgi:hypothetical protein
MAGGKSRLGFEDSDGEREYLESKGSTCPQISIKSPALPTRVDESHLPVICQANECH